MSLCQVLQVFLCQVCQRSLCQVGHVIVSGVSGLCNRCAKSLYQVYQVYETGVSGLCIRCVRSLYQVCQVFVSGVPGLCNRCVRSLFQVPDLLTWSTRLLTMRATIFVSCLCTVYYRSRRPPRSVFRQGRVTLSSNVAPPGLVGPQHPVQEGGLAPLPAALHLPEEVLEGGGHLRHLI